MKWKCQVCNEELKENTEVWIKCDYWNYHPIGECGGCNYPVGKGCAKKIPKQFKGGY